jgi:hypothetical protein
MWSRRSASCLTSLTGRMSANGGPSGQIVSRGMAGIGATTPLARVSAKDQNPPFSVTQPSRQGHRPELGGDSQPVRAITSITAPAALKRAKHFLGRILGRKMIERKI